jgi:hypothetical protein
MEDGNESILASDNEAFVIDTWYDIGMKIWDDKLIAIVNNNPVLTTSDYTFKEGRPGFWTNSLQNAHFDDIKISASDSTWTVNNSRRYIFDTGSGLALAGSLCDWTPDSQKNLYQYNQWGSCIYYLSKKVFEEVTLNNINTFYENFKIEVNANRIPQDIDAVFEFTSQGEEAIVYKFIISKEKITLLKNGKMLASNTITSDREKIAIYRRDNEWTIELAAKKAFEYKDEIEPGHWNMATGYSGPGKGQIFLNYIIIDDHL